MWLRGSTDAANIQADLYGLLTGTLAAGSRGAGQSGNGNQVSGIDAWISIDAPNNVIRSQAVEPIQTEWPMWRGIPRFCWYTSGSPTVPSNYPITRGKPTFTGTYSAGTARAVLYAYVSTINTTAGTLAGTIVTWVLYNSITGSSVLSGTTSGWTGTTNTQVLTSGISLTLTLAAGESFIAGAVGWHRAYTTVYTQGIDYHPDFGRVASSLVLATSSGGANAYTAGTDYTLVQINDLYPQDSASASGGSLGTYAGYGWGGAGCATGIHWTVGGAPPAVGVAYYFTSANLYAAYVKIQFNNPGVYMWTMDSYDIVNAVGRSISPALGNTFTTSSTQVMNAFSGSQPSSTYINYWISIKRDKIVITIRGDLAFSGQTHVHTLQKYTPQDPTIDKNPWASVNTISGSGSSEGFKNNRMANIYPYYGPHPSSILASASTPRGKWGATFSGSGQQNNLQALGPSSLPNTNPNPYTGTWWLYDIFIHEFGFGKTAAGLESEQRYSGIRGYLNGIFTLGSDGWTNLDELVDGATTYLLVNPFTNFPNQSNAFYAILEE